MALNFRILGLAACAVTISAHGTLTGQNPPAVATIGDFAPPVSSIRQAIGDSTVSTTDHSIIYAFYHLDSSGRVSDARLKRWRFDGVAASTEDWHGRAVDRSLAEITGGLADSSRQFRLDDISDLREVLLEPPSQVLRYDGFRSGRLDLIRFGKSGIGWRLTKDYRPSTTRLHPRIRPVLDRVPGFASHGSHSVLLCTAGTDDGSTSEIFFGEGDAFNLGAISFDDGRIASIRWRSVLQPDAEELEPDILRKSELVLHHMEYYLEVTARDSENPALPRRAKLSAVSDQARYRDVYFLMLEIKPLTESEREWLTDLNAVPPDWDGDLDEVVDEAFGFTSFENGLQASRKQANDRVESAESQRRALRAEFGLAGGIALLAFAGWLALRRGRIGG